MTTQDLINTLRQGAPVTARQVKAIVSQLERIPAMERVIAAKDRDFTQLSIAYTAAIEAGKAKGVQFTFDECGYVENALEECARLKEAVRWFLECAEWKLRLKIWFVTEPKELEARATYQAARKAVEDLL